ncbi:MAG: M42 family metallopeptidase [Verrucomicrobia bacterium]|nr:M42 family metallopeptidase [Verrucomicrobiota bacterium]MCH8513298.1 M42 family metallopeptidase [Kiritimatiellia bacterium]
MKKNTEAVLKRLIESISPSGFEGPAANIFREEAQQFADEVTRDRHGNTIAKVNGTGDLRVMFAGHCDEIGFLITHIDKKGYCWIAPIGGWDPQIAQGQRVQIRAKKAIVPGVIGKKPIHLMSPEDRKNVVQLKDMWVDIGAKDRKEAEKMVSVGDPLVVDQGYGRLAGDIAVARGMDNRVGAFTVLEAARRVAKSKNKAAATLYSVATVQEEIGLRGATTSAFGIDAHLGIAVDVTFAGDHPGLGDAVRTVNECELGKGPVLTRGANTHHRVFELIVATAKKHNIPLQINAEGRGTGTDANAMQLSRGGMATALLSIPNRYMHSPCELVDLRDVEACIELMAQTVLDLANDTDLTPF